MRRVTVYGPGCRRCETLAKMVEEAAAGLGIGVEIGKVTNPAEIVRAGVLSTPGLAVDGRLVHVGGLPTRAQIEAWIAA